MKPLLPVLIIFTIVTFHSACKSEKSKLLEARSPSESNLEVAQLEAVDEGFRIFDPEINFQKYYNLSDPKYARDNFRVFDDDSSQIATINVEDLLAARFALLEQAKKSVRLQTLTFWGDETGWTFTRKLIELRKRGIDVKVIIDSVSNLGPATQKMYFELQQNGVQVQGYEPLYLFFLEEFSPQDSLLTKISKINLRFHEKMFIVDAETPDTAQMIMGGANFSKQYFRVEKNNPLSMWTDQDVMLKGKIVLDAAKMFDENFNEFQEHKRFRSRFNIEQLWNLAQRIVHGKNRDEILQIKTPEFDEEIVAEIENKKTKLTPLTWHQGPMRLLRNRPRFTEYYIGDALLSMLEDAKHEVLIANSFFIPDKITINAILDAAKRGVKIKILTNSLASSLFAPLPIASRSKYAAIMSANKGITNGGGVEIYEWQSDKILNNGEGQLHAKYAIFDDIATLVGSFNIDPRSMNFNSENNVATLNEGLAQDLKTTFNSQISEGYSRFITDDEAAGYDQADSLSDKIKNKFSFVISPFL